MYDALLNRFNQIRKKKYFNSLHKPQKKYAFVGVGMHSLTNFYPLIHYFGVDLKYICTKGSSWSKQMAIFFPKSSFTNTLKDITQDSEIDGVFVCASPESHYGLLVELFRSEKKVFIEKPPCTGLRELEELVRMSQSKVCKVGLQRKYWPGNKYALKRIKSAKSYFYQFHFGPYIQGDPFVELFIHALDYSIHLFGNFELNSFSTKKDKKGVTAQLHINHQQGISGLIELSTHFSWNAPDDCLSVNCDNESLIIQYPVLVKGEQKPKRLLNMPSERILHQPLVSREYFSTHNLIAPVMELNTLVLQGFYDEINTFLQITENNILDQSANDLEGLIAVYQIIEKLKKGK